MTDPQTPLPEEPEPKESKEPEKSPAKPKTDVVKGLGLIAGITSGVIAGGGAATMLKLLDNRKGIKNPALWISFVTGLGTLGLGAAGKLGLFNLAGVAFGARLLQAVPSFFPQPPSDVALTMKAIEPWLNPQK